jgi:RNA polymerase sigma-70 factor (ECF subfamily)
MFFAIFSTALSVTAPQRGVTDDFETLYETWFDFVWRSLRRLGVAESQIDDATQEVFLVVHRRLGDFEGRSSIKTWLFGIALRVASDVRRWNRRKNQHDPLTDDEAVATTDDPHELTSRREAARAIERCLGAIPEERRAVFVMMELEEMTAPEVAEAMSIPLNTVYSRLRLARADFERAAALIRRSNS